MESVCYFCVFLDFFKSMVFYCIKQVLSFKAFEEYFLIGL